MMKGMLCWVALTINSLRFLNIRCEDLSGKSVATRLSSDLCEPIFVNESLTSTRICATNTRTTTAAIMTTSTGFPLQLEIVLASASHCRRDFLHRELRKITHFLWWRGEILATMSSHAHILTKTIPSSTELWIDRVMHRPSLAAWRVPVYELIRIKPSPSNTTTTMTISRGWRCRRIRLPNRGDWEIVIAQ